jgi:hypothetical protein
MQTKNSNKGANKSTSSKKGASVKKETVVANVTTLNLAKFADKLKNVEIKEIAKKQTIYIYPENFTPKMINEKEGKQFRSARRNQLKRFVNNVLLYAKYPEKYLDNLHKEIADFEVYYKTFYRLNDYSFASLSQSKDESKEADLKLFLEILNEIRNAK